MTFSAASIIAVLALCVVASEWLVRRTFFRHFGTALLVIVLTAIVANLGLIPAGSSPERPVPVYEGIFSHLAPVSIFWLLLRVNLRHVASAGGPIILAFVLGAVGTVLGVVVAFSIVDASPLGELTAPLAGMFAATYTGGSVNFNAVALHYDVVRAGNIYSGTVVVDNVITAVWMVATIAIPRLLTRTRAASREPAADQNAAEDEETVQPWHLAVLLALGFFALEVAQRVHEAGDTVGFRTPTIITVTVLALILAQIPAVARLRGSQLLGMTAVYVFLAVIGAFCDLAALAAIGDLGVTLSFVAITCVLVHGAVTFGVGTLMRIDPDVAAVASQANIGGGTSALALARSLGRSDLVLPAVLVGSVGSAVGTFLGFAVVGFLGG